MFFAEVFSGASTLWFISVWGLLVTFPLYLGHTLFLFNLAIRTGRTSLRQLYFFGMLFGLYEALITKVLWYGYPDSAGAMVGYFIGVAWGEFLTLVLFWHPVMSFILPILMYELLSRDHIPGHEWLIKKSRGTLLGVIVLILMGAVLQSNGSKIQCSGLSRVCGRVNFDHTCFTSLFRGENYSVSHSEAKRNDPLDTLLGNPLRCHNTSSTT